MWVVHALGELLVRVVDMCGILQSAILRAHGGWGVVLEIPVAECDGLCGRLLCGESERECRHKRERGKVEFLMSMRRLISVAECATHKNDVRDLQKQRLY